MIWFIIFSLIALIVFIVGCCCKCFDGAWEGFLGFVLTQLAGLAAAWLCVLVSLFVATCVAKTEWVPVETTNISALNDSASTYGRFFLGSGYVNEELQYYFIKETEKGKIAGSIDADNAYIIESNTETPRIERWEERIADDIWLWFTISKELGVSEYRIYIPENSVTTDFNIDLESGNVNLQGPTTTIPAITDNFCSKCGHQLNKTDNFCPSCGTPAISATPNCPSCDKELKEDVNFCPSCGTATGDNP